MGLGLATMIGGGLEIVAGAGSEGGSAGISTPVSVPLIAHGVFNVGMGANQFKKGWDNYWNNTQEDSWFSKQLQSGYGMSSTAANTTEDIVGLVTSGLGIPKGPKIGGWTGDALKNAAKQRADDAAYNAWQTSLRNRPTNYSKLEMEMRQMQADKMADKIINSSKKTKWDPLMGTF